jgi:hypothetical protein
MATLSTYRTLVQAEVDDDSARAQTVIDEGLQEVYQEILRHTARFLVGTSVFSPTIVVATKNYTITAFYEIVEALYHNASSTNFNVLKQIEQKDFIEKYYNISDGTPSMYYQNGNDIVLVAGPADVGTLNVVYVPVQNELTGNETSVIPDRYKNVMVLGGIARFKAYEAVPEAVDYQLKYIAAIQDMKKELGSRFTPTKRRLWGR